MDRAEEKARDRVQNVLLDYNFGDILELNDMTIEDVLIFMYLDLGIKLPETLDGLT